MAKKSRWKKVTALVLGIIMLLLICCIGYNKVMLMKEKKICKPLGIMVNVNGHQMSIYKEGNGEKTIVFMSGSGTCSPILDFRTLSSRLSDKFRIVIIEKFGYGFSDTTDDSRDIDTILSQTRVGLQAAEIKGPFILCPHSMSGIEALYWQQLYPEEVEAIVGLDMAVKETYANFKPGSVMLSVSALVARSGILRMIPGSSESDAIKYGTLTEKEKDIYRAIFYQKTQTKNMVNEIKMIHENAEKLDDASKVKVPIILFSSNGNGTGFDSDYWLQCQDNFIKAVPNGKHIKLKCTHYVHDIEYERIANVIRASF